MLAISDDDIMSYIAHYFRKHGYAPSYREIASAVNYGSTSSVKTRMDKLFIKGFLETDEDELSARAFRVSDKYAEKYGGTSYEG